MFLSDFLSDVYMPARPQSRDGRLTYLAAIAKLEQHAGRRLDVAELSESVMQSFLNAYREEWSAASTNNKRKHLCCLWRFAARRGLHRYPDEDQIPRFRTPKREPRAWTPEEYGKLLQACWRMRRIRKGGIEWSPLHWRGFLFVQYDTAHRRGALLSYPNEGRITTRTAQVQNGFLTVKAEHTKQCGDAVHKLHQDTLAAIAAMPPHDALFPWPRGERLLDAEYRVLLAYAGLEQSRENGTHKNRRTSVTQVAIKRGIAAASMHARHGSESVTRRSYVDFSQLPVESAVDVMDRPC